MVCEKIRFCLLESGRTKPWCPGLVSRPSAKAQGPLARSRGQWQEVEGLLFSPQNTQLVHILSFHSQAVVSIFIFPTGPIALDSEPRGRRYVKNTGHDRNCLYSRAIHCPASMVHIWSFRSYGVVFLFIFPTGPTALDSEPRGRRYVKNMGHNRNRLYSRSIHCPASMEKHYVQWFILKSVWFPYSSFQQVRQPSIPRPVEEDMSKI